jgi:hypothetical protein
MFERKSRHDIYIVGSGKEKRRKEDKKNNIRIQSNFGHVRDERNNETANHQHDGVRYLEPPCQRCYSRNQEHKKEEY